MFSVSKSCNNQSIFNVFNLVPTYGVTSKLSAHKSGFHTHIAHSMMQTHGTRL